MCFSATASFTAGAVLTATGVVTLKKARHKNEVPLASVPLIFGIQQLIEGVVWISFGNMPLNTIATYAFAFISHVWWPIFVPIAVYVLEKNSKRKRILSFFIACGLIVGLTLLYNIIRYPVSSQVCSNSIGYNIEVNDYGYVLVPLYMLATCASPLFSSYKLIKILGITVFISSIIAVIFYQFAFASVWCFFAAILSLLIFWFLKSSKLQKV